MNDTKQTADISIGSFPRKEGRTDGCLLDRYCLRGGSYSGLYREVYASQCTCPQCRNKDDTQPCASLRSSKNEGEE